MQEYLFQGIEDLGSTIYSPRKEEIQIGVISFTTQLLPPEGGRLISGCKPAEG
jgi:hypothetical protein